MSRSVWTPIQREANRWNHDSAKKANQRTLDRIAAAENHRNLLRDITKLAIIESRFPEIPKDAESGIAARIPCPICKSKEFLVESFHHPSVLVCERPNCIYARAVKRRDKMVEELDQTQNLRIVK